MSPKKEEKKEPPITNDQPEEYSEVSDVMSISEDEKQEEEYIPSQYSTQLERKQRLYQSLKVGLAALLTSLIVLIEPWNKVFHGTGEWAVITVVLVILKTPGDTTQKIINRFAGTLVAAMLALLVGTVGHELRQAGYSVAGSVLVAATIAVVGVGGTWSKTTESWSYGMRLGTATYPFMALSTLANDDHVAIFRIAMITIGGLVGFVIAWLPPHIKASDVSKAYLLDELVDTARCVECVVDNFLSGKVIHPIPEIYMGQGDDDPAHQLSKAVSRSRTSLESAVEATKWEVQNHSTAKSHLACGVAVRLTLRAILGADTILRYGGHNFSLDHDNETEAKLSLAFQETADAINVELGNAVHDLGCDPPPRMLCHQERGGDLSGSIEQLEKVMREYVANSNPQTKFQRFCNHVTFAQNLIDTANLALKVRETITDDSTRHSAEEEEP